MGLNETDTFNFDPGPLSGVGGRALVAGAAGPRTCGSSGPARGRWSRGAGRWRGLAYEYGGFWRGLSWVLTICGPAAVMFTSYGSLNSGFLHLLVNMITLVSLGQIVIERAGQPRFAVIYGGAWRGSRCFPPPSARRVLGRALRARGGRGGLADHFRRAAREGLGPVLRGNGVPTPRYDGRSTGWQPRLGDPYRAAS